MKRDRQNEAGQAGHTGALRPRSPQKIQDSPALRGGSLSERALDCVTPGAISLREMPTKLDSASTAAVDSVEGLPSNAEQC
jgi:hypothetical protein